MKVVRWLGAYGKGDNLSSSLHWELTQTERKELAAEPIFLRNNESSYLHCKVGLLVRRKAIRKIFSGDVWSVVTGDGKLRKTRSPKFSNSHHGEAFVSPDYCAIVVRKWSNLAKDTRKLLVSYAKRFNLKILDLDNNWREEDIRFYQC